MTKQQNKKVIGSIGVTVNILEGDSKADKYLRLMNAVVAEYVDIKDSAALSPQPRPRKGKGTDAKGE